MHPTIARFTQALQLKNVAPGTLYRYQRDLSLCLAHSGILDPNLLEEQHVRAFLLALVPVGVKRLHARDWVVYAKPPFSSAQQVLQYLGHYTHRFGLSNSRLQEVKDGCIRFKTRGAQSVTLRLEEFFRRFTLHILPERFMRIRHYGLLGSGNRKKLEKARALLNASGEGLSWSLEKAVLQQKEKEKEKEDRPRKEKTCPGCGGTHITRKPLEGLLEGREPKRRGWELLVEKLRRLAGGIEARTGPS